MKRIGILTSGGDAPGMNACVRACVRLAIDKGFDVYAINRGYQGLVENEVWQLNSRSVSDIIQRGGTVLKTARSEEFRTMEGLEKAYETIKKHDISSLICIGGDGTFRGAKDLTDNFNIAAIGIPGTIDNDLAYTDYTLGFDTAVNTVLWAINSLRDTMGSHDRASCLEVMGRKCGDIALYAGLCGGAEYILVPEIPFDIDEIAEGLIQSRELGKTSNMIVFSEGAGNRYEICKEITEKSGVKIKTTTLGHIQRGGAPTMFDRLLAAKMASHAIDLIEKDVARNNVVGMKCNQIFDMDISEALSVERLFDYKLYKLANILAK